LVIAVFSCGKSFVTSSELCVKRVGTMRDACRFDASDGHLELFKTTKQYDGDLGREMHGFPSNAELPL
jgi:hypothetical protein